MRLLQVLPDGTVVKINRTVISDSSDDGNTFFFSSTSFHNVQTPGDVENDKDTDMEEVEERDFDEYGEVPVLGGNDESVEYPDDEEKVVDAEDATPNVGVPDIVE